MKTKKSFRLILIKFYQELQKTGKIANLIMRQ